MTILRLAVALLVFSVVNYITFALPSTSNGLGWWGEQFPVVILSITIGVMFAGIFLGCLHRRVLAKRSENINVLKEFKSVVKSRSFVAALCVSPFVFMSVFLIVNKSPGDPSSYLLAFQNRFFCEAVFGSMFADPVPGASRPAKAGTPPGA